MGCSVWVAKDHQNMMGETMSNSQRVSMKGNDCKFFRQACEQLRRTQGPQYRPGTCLPSDCTTCGFLLFALNVLTPLHFPLRLL